jgi:hypothetical protein
MRDGSEVEVGKPLTVMIVCGISRPRVYPIAQSINSRPNSSPTSCSYRTAARGRGETAPTNVPYLANTSLTGVIVTFAAGIVSLIAPI